MPKNGPKKAAKVSTKDRMPIWLNKGSQNIPIAKPITAIVKPEIFKENLFGKKFNNEFWIGT